MRGYCCTPVAQFARRALLYERLRAYNAVVPQTAKGSAMKITKMGQIIVKNNTGHLIGWSCRFGRDRWVSITIHPTGVVCFDNASLSTKLWVMKDAQRPKLREHLAGMLKAEREINAMLKTRKEMHGY